MIIFMTEKKSAYCAVRTGSLNTAVCASPVKGQHIADGWRRFAFLHYNCARWM